MFDISAFFALEPGMGKAGAVLLAGILNLVFAALTFALPNNMAPGEEGVMREAREIAITVRSARTLTSCTNSFGSSEMILMASVQASAAS